MKRSNLLLSVLCIVSLSARGQCIVAKDSYGQVTTTCQLYFPQTGTERLHKQVVYLGNEFFSFPEWQQGKIQLDESGQEILCQLAYNLVTNKVMCQLAKDIAPREVTPYAFTINGTTFNRQPNTTLGIKHDSYFTTLHNGRTKLLKSLTRRFIPKLIRNSYEQGSVFEGYYETQERYYIRKGDAQPQLTNLSKNSFLTILHDQANAIAARLTGKHPENDEIAAILVYYDSLTTVSDANKPSLSRNAAFSVFLHNQLKYPNQAWNSGVYGRVYAVFEVNEGGRVTNITLLSPDNIGFGSDQVVMQALTRLSKVKPEFVGKYALPVTFTYTNTQHKEAIYVPINKLSTDRFEGRTVLEEFMVPIVVSKPSITSREVWGYYR